MEYERLAALYVAHNLQKKKTETLFTVLNQYMGYEPTVTEALCSLKRFDKPNGEETWSWDDKPFITFYPSERQPLGRLPSLSNEITVKVNYQLHFTSKQESDQC